MKLTDVLATLKSVIEADGFFAPLASTAHDDYAGGDVLLCDDLLPGATTVTREMERALEEHGLALVAALMEGDSDGEADEGRESSTVLLIVTENVFINRRPGGFGQTALAAMQRVKATVATANWEDGGGTVLAFSHFTKGDAPAGTVSYYLEYTAKTNH